MALMAADKDSFDEKRKEVLSKDNQAKRQLVTLIGLSEKFGDSLSNASA
jgi:hypothetical protein